MGRSIKHSGQADAEKSRRYIDPEYRKRKREQEKCEDERYAALCGPVEVKRVEK